MSKDKQSPNLEKIFKELDKCTTPEDTITVYSSVKEYLAIKLDNQKKTKAQEAEKIASLNIN